MYKFLKIFLVIICLLFNITMAKAELTDYVPHKMIVQFEDDFSSNYPKDFFSVIINDNYEVKNIGTIVKGTKLYLEVLKISNAKRAKKDACVEARILKVYNPVDDKVIIVKNQNAVVTFSKYEKLDKVNVTANIGITVANQFIKNLTYPAHFVKGIVENKDGNRLKSGAKEVFESSPLSYIEKGDELDLHAGDLATLTYFTKKCSSD